MPTIIPNISPPVNAPDPTFGRPEVVTSTFETPLIFETPFFNLFTSVLAFVPVPSESTTKTLILVGQNRNTRFRLVRFAIHDSDWSKPEFDHRLHWIKG